MLRKLLLTATLATVFLFALSLTTAVAMNPHPPGGTGQPGETCLSDNAKQEPGNTPNSPGSPFNEVNGIGGSNYSPTSQYDVACFQVSQSHP